MWLIGNVTRADVISGIRAAWRVTAATLKVLVVTVGSLFAVVFASLIISIIQFQLRLNEARAQNDNITLESIQLIADYQDNYKKFRARNNELYVLRVDYLSKLNSTSQLMTNLCAVLAPKKAKECYLRLQILINNNNNQIDSVVAEYASENSDAAKEGIVPAYVATLKKIVTSGALQEAHTKFVEAQRLVEIECQQLTEPVLSILGRSPLLSVLPEVRATVYVKCYQGNVGNGASDSPTNATPVSATDQSPPQQNSEEVSGVNKVLLSELVFYYKFYDGLTSYAGADLRQIILAPPEFVVIMLVIATGILGSFLYHSYTMFLARSMDDFPSFFSIGLRATLSVMCALVIYILSRTGFVAITEGGGRRAEAAISPFVIAFISVVSGLMAEKALQRIRSIGTRALEGEKVAAGDGTAAGDEASQGAGQQ